MKFEAFALIHKRPAAGTSPDDDTHLFDAVIEIADSTPANQVEAVTTETLMCA